MYILGKLTAEVKDPHNNRVPAQIDTSSDGKNTLVFTPKVEGKTYKFLYIHFLVSLESVSYQVDRNACQ